MSFCLGCQKPYSHKCTFECSYDLSCYNRVCPDVEYEAKGMEGTNYQCVECSEHDAVVAKIKEENAGISSYDFESAVYWFYERNRIKE